VLLASSAVPAIAGIRAALETAPNEARVAGLLLRSIGSPGEGVMARKPHVAYFADMTYVPLPDLEVSTIPALIDFARSRGARYLFFSTAEQATRPQLGVLAGRGVSLPGIRQIAYRAMSPGTYYALYEFTGDRFAAASLDSAVLTAALQSAQSRPGSLPARIQVVSELFDRGLYREAIPQLEIAEKLDPRDLRTARMQAFAYYRLGQYEQAAAACERAIRNGGDAGWEQSQMGAIRMRQKRPGDAIGYFREALRREPGNTTYLYLLGTALYEHGERPAAIREFEKVLSVSPGHPQARYFAARAWQLEGDPRRALAVLDGADPAAPGAPVLKAFADSLRAATPR
jgi:tetratricopeptide (TPR) repeat protein